MAAETWSNFKGEPVNNHHWTHRLAVRGLCMAIVLSMAGCASSVRLDEIAPVEDRSPGAGQTGVAPVGTGPNDRGSVPGRGLTGVAPVETAVGVATTRQDAGRTVYFDFDSFSVREDGRPIVQAQGRRLTQDRQRGLLLEGHTDDRGGREYNLALGQKRADAVQRALLLLGVAATQLEAVSLGEERPADAAGTEAAWARNRRVELKDR